MTQRRITDDLHALLGVLPSLIAEAVEKANNSDNLLEIILDLGRRPEMAFFWDDPLARGALRQALAAGFLPSQAE